VAACYGAAALVLVLLMLASTLLYANERFHPVRETSPSGHHAVISLSFAGSPFSESSIAAAAGAGADGG
jgi:hypothetical protein